MNRRAQKFIVACIVIFFIVFLSLPKIASAQKTPPRFSSPKKTEGIGVGFDRTGRMRAVYVKEGDRVRKGQPLAELDRSELTARIHLLNAETQIEKAKLRQLENRGVLENSETQDPKFRSAQINLDNVRRDIAEDALPSAYTAAMDAVRNKVDQFFINLKSASPQPSFGVSDNLLLLDLSTKRTAMELLLVSWKSGLSNIAQNDLFSRIEYARGRLRRVQDFLETATAALNGVQPDVPSVVTNRNWRLDVSSALTGIDNAIKNLTLSQGKLYDAQFNVDMWRSARADASSPSSLKDAVEIQKWAVKRAEANAEIAQASIDAMTLRAPANGLVTKVLTQSGVVIPSTLPLIYITPY